jgi:hypothetical protein
LNKEGEMSANTEMIVMIKETERRLGRAVTESRDRKEYETARGLKGILGWAKVLRKQAEDNYWEARDAD